MWLEQCLHLTVVVYVVRAVPTFDCRYRESCFHRTFSYVCPRPSSLMSMDLAIYWVRESTCLQSISYILFAYLMTLFNCSYMCLMRLGGGGRGDRARKVCTYLSTRCTFSCDRLTVTHSCTTLNTAAVACVGCSSERWERVIPLSGTLTLLWVQW